MKQRRVKTFSYFFMVMAAMLCSCSSDDDATTPQEDSNERCMRQLTIANVPVNTRATIDPSTYAATWATTDRPTYINLSMLSAELLYGTLTPTGTEATTTLTGIVYCQQGDYIAIVLPTVEPVLSSGGNASYTINLGGQKGTLADIGARYHYVYGVGSVTSTDGSTATGTITNTKSLLSLCKFTFTKGGSPVSVQSVQIGWGKDGAAGYPQTGTVSLANPENASAVAGNPNGPLTVTLDNANSEGVVYVALFPCGEKLTFHFTVSDGTGGTYAATKHAKILEGKYYEVPVAVE